MNKMQQQVKDFIVGAEQEYAATPDFKQAELRARLIQEEAEETVEAIKNRDIVLTVDGICDLLYVTLGAAVAFGIDIEPFFDEVHRSNMEKLKGPIRADGKRLKPEDWQPPKIAEMLKELC